MDLTSIAATAWNVFKVLFPTLLLIGLFVNWMAWIAGWGRFGEQRFDARRRETTIRYMIVKFMTEIINDFKHILAIMLTFMFVGTLFWVLYFAWAHQKNFEFVKDGLQVVVSSLGGLIGSIVGYYFGESAASRRLTAQAPLDTIGREEVQVGFDSSLQEATRPADLGGMDEEDEVEEQDRDGE